MEATLIKKIGSKGLDLVLERIKYLASDRMAIIVFIFMIIKNLLFINVLSTSGASKLKAKIVVNSSNSIVMSLVFLLIFLSFAYIFYRRAHLAALVILNIIYSVLLIGDLWIYRGFNSFLSLHMLSETGNLNNLSTGVASMMRPVDIVFVVDNFIVIILAILHNKYYKNMRKIRGIFPVIFILCALGIFHFYESPATSGLFKTQWIPLVNMRNLSPMGYHLYDTAMFVQDNSPYKLNAADKQEIDSWIKYKNEDLPDNQYKGIFKGKNLIVLQVESLENFILNHSYGNQELTPNLNKMLKNSIYFPNYFEQVNNGTSSDADLMTNASVLPVRRGSTFFRFPTNKYNTLARIFKSDGYAAEAYHADYGYYWNVKNALSHFGFDKFTDLSQFPQKDVYWMGLTDKCFLTQTEDMIKKGKKPFYSFAVTTTSHMPFKMRADMKSLNLPKSFDDTYMGGYYQSFHYTDQQIGDFINTLDKDGLLDNTVIAIYGDHTSIHKYYGDEVAKMKDQESWWDNGYRIPLIIYSKGMKGQEIDTNGGQVDILPTLAYAFGIDKNKYEYTSMGRNLLNTKKSYAILTNGKIMGQETLSKKDIDHVNQSFDVADKIIRSNYFTKK